MSNTKVIILAGGIGSRLFEETISIPKPLVELNGKPLLIHVIENFSKYNYNSFIICLGHKADSIVNYFKNIQNTELISESETEIHLNVDKRWDVLLAFTGLETMTGGRIKKVEKFINDDFFISYSDNYTNINPTQLKEKSNGKICTLTTVNPLLPYGVIILDKDKVIGFDEKPALKNTYINAGMFYCKKDFFNYIKNDDSSILEVDVMQSLVSISEVNSYHHNGIWMSINTYKDLLEAREQLK